MHAFDFVRKLKEEGKVKHIGFSIHDSADHIDRILTLHPEMEFVQIQLNYIDWENEGIQAKKCYEVCQKHGKPVIVMEPVKGGTLVNLPEAAEELLKMLTPTPPWPPGPSAMPPASTGWRWCFQVCPTWNKWRIISLT